MPQVSRNIPHNTELERRILRELESRVRQWERKVQAKYEDWRKAEEKVLAYIPETEVSRKRRKSREQGVPDYTAIQIPYSYAVVMSALTYITSVFFGRTPVFQYSGRHGEGEQQVLALEACIDYQLMNGYMLPNLYTWIYDMLKYGYGVIGCYWEDRIEVVSDIVDQPQFDPTTGAVSMVPTPVMQPMRTYAGNRLFNVQPQDFIWDVRWPARSFHKGEYAGRRVLFMWNELVRGARQGVYINLDHIKTRERDMFMRDTGSPELDRPEAFADEQVTAEEMSGMATRRPAAISGYEIVVEIIPQEWGLGASDWPEKWVFGFTADFSTLIRCHPQGALHCAYPYDVIALEPEGYGMFIRGMPEILDPVQNTIDWLINSHFFNVRAALNNKYVVDPSRVVMKDVLNPLPGGIVRLKPEAYGTDTKLVMTQQPVNDVTQQHLPNTNFMLQFGERIIGVNDQIMGMVDTGGRKTATEVRTSTSMGVNRLKTQAEFASSTGFDPLSKKLVQNTQQYYDMALKMRIAGDLMQSAGPKFVMVTPDLVGGFYDFVPVDGTMPIDRFAMVNLWKELFQAILTVPMIGMQYDLAGIFQWVAQLAGLRNITRFKIQVQPDQMLAMAAMQGNSVPLGRNAGSAGARSARPSDNRQGYQQPLQANAQLAQQLLNGAG